MSITAASAELHASRRWVLTMAILALVLLGFWCVVTTAAWVIPGVFPQQAGWEWYFFRGFFAQLTFLAYAAILPFLSLLRYARALAALGTADREVFARAVGLHGLFWRQCSWLMWGMVWLLAYALVGGVVGRLCFGR